MAWRCKNCKRCATAPKRGLCHKCYQTPGIRDKFPPDENSLCRGIADRCGNQKLPAAPTIAWPGTEAKVRVLMERAMRGEQLFHPMDAGMPDWLKAAGDVPEGKGGDGVDGRPPVVIAFKNHCKEGQNAAVKGGGGSKRGRR